MPGAIWGLENLVMWVREGEAKTFCPCRQKVTCIEGSQGTRQNISDKILCRLSYDKCWGGQSVCAGCGEEAKEVFIKERT